MPELAKVDCSGIGFFTDENLFSKVGVRVAFTTRQGGVSASPWESLNLATHVHDDSEAVAENRRRLLEALKAAPGTQLIVPNQVHGENVAVIHHAPDMNGEMQRVRREVACGADAIVCLAPHVAPMLCYADCMPVILVAPSGAFAVIHAGWRGVEARIVAAAIEKLASESCTAHAGREARCAADAHPGEYNAYIGPYIHSECFEVSEDLAQRFSNMFGQGAVPDARHVDLGFAVRKTLEEAQISPRRICDIAMCTACNTHDFYSHRAENGHTGRHAAIAFMDEESIWE